jgi:hypothetical protein
MLVLAAGCAENQAATTACKDKSRTSDACNECCRSNGANGHTWVNGDCKCRGGG